MSNDNLCFESDRHFVLRRLTFSAKVRTTHGHRTIRRWGWRERRNARWCRLVTYCYRILRNDQLKVGYPLILLFPTEMDTGFHAANYQLHEFKVTLSYLLSGILCRKLLSILIYWIIVIFFSLFLFRSWRSNMVIQKLVLLIITHKNKAQQSS